MKFDIISIVYIAIVAIMFLVGLKKGFMKVLINFIKGTVAILVAIVLSKPLAKLIIGTNLGTNFVNLLTDTFTNKGGIFIQTVTEATKTDVISQALTELKIPEVLNNIFLQLMDKLISAEFIPAEGATVATVLGNVIAYYAILVVMFILLFVAARIVASLLNKILNSLIKIPLIGMLNSLAGGVINAAIGVVVVCLISYGISFLIPVNETLGTWLTNTMALNDDSVTSISKYLYQNNYIAKIIVYLQTLSF